MTDPAPKRPTAPWSKAPAQAVWQSKLPKCLQRGVAGKIAAHALEDGTLTKPMTVAFLFGAGRNGRKDAYPGGRTLTRREVQYQLRALERIGFLKFDPDAYVGRNHPRAYTVDFAALDTIDLTDHTTFPRAGRWKRKGAPMGAPLGEPLGAPMGALLPGLYTDPDPDPDQSSGLCPSPGGTGTTSEQQREKRAASPDVATTSGWFQRRDHAALDADLATLPIPGLFASPRQARKFGYRLIDARRGQLHGGSIGGLPLATFDDWVAALQVTIEAAGIITAEAICRQAMADCIVERAQRDRSFDPDADRERRRGRK